MLKMKRHHMLILIGITIFVVAWGIWTMILLPRSESPNLPNPGEPAPGSQAPVLAPTHP